MFASCSVREPVYCVQLEASDGDWIIIYVALGSDQRCDRKTIGPHLVKARWGGKIIYGEYVLTNERYHRFLWGEENEPSLTDFGRRPVMRGEKILVFEGEDREGPSWEFSVVNVFRV